VAQADCLDAARRNAGDAMSVADRGFASMSRQRQLRVARKGGIMAHRLGRAHEWTSAEAAIAGRKGGQACQRAKARQRAAEVAK
jgi:uncharacterized protein